MTRNHAGRWCNGQHATPVDGDPGSNPVASAKESASDTVCGFLFAVLAQRSVPQSSKPMMRVRFPHTARYDSMPVGSSRRGSHDHAGRVRWSTSPFVRRTRGPSPVPIILWVDDSRQPSVGRVGANPIKPIRPVRERFPGTWATAFLVSRPTGCGNGLGGAWASQPVIPVMPHAVVRASTAGMGAGIRHEWPDPQWTARAYPCGLPAHAFVAQPVEATVQGTVRSGFESRRKHQRKQRRQRHPIRFERLPERERCHGRFSS